MSGSRPQLAAPRRHAHKPTAQRLPLEPRSTGTEGCNSSADKTIFKIWTTYLNLWQLVLAGPAKSCKPEGLSPSKFKPSCQATVAPVVSSAQCRASMENRHWRSQAAHRVQKLMLVALVAVVAMDLSNCQAVCLCGTSSHAGHMGRRF